MPGFFHLGVAKSPKPTKTLWLGFLSSWLALPRILFPSSKWLDRPRTNLWLTLNSPVYHFQVRTNTKEE